MPDERSDAAAEPVFLRLVRHGGAVTCTGQAAVTLGWPVAGGVDGQRDGVFAEWRWQGDRLTVTNDRYGFQPLFWYARDGEIALAPSIPKLLELGGPRELDYAALAVFLRLGYFVGDETPFVGIRVLPPSATLQWSKGKVQLDVRARVVAAQTLSRDDALDAYVARFRRAIERRPPPDGELVLPLSGGRDSRHILLELCRAGWRPRACVTKRTSVSDDVEVAAELCRVLDIPHIVLEPSPSRLQDELRKNLLTNFCADEHGWFISVADFLRGRTSAVYDGLGGGVLSSSQFLSPERLALARAGKVEELARALMPESREGRLGSLLPEPYYRRVAREDAEARIVSELRRFVADPNPLAAFVFANRTRREIALSPYGILRDVGPVYAPYVDHDVYDLLAGLPAEMLLDGKFHTDAIHRAFPHLAHIRYGGSTARSFGPRRRRQHAGAFLRYLATGPRPRHIRLTYTVPRAIRSALDPRFHWNGNMETYLVQLERLAAG